MIWGTVSMSSRNLGTIWISHTSRVLLLFFRLAMRFMQLLLHGCTSPAPRALTKSSIVERPAEVVVGCRLLVVNFPAIRNFLVVDKDGRWGTGGV